MAQPVQTPETVSTASGLTDVFATVWTFETAAEVVLSVTVDGVTTPQAQGVAYVVSAGDWLNDGAELVFQPGHRPPAGATVTRVRRTVQAQPHPYGDDATFRPSQNEKSFDRLTRMVQDVRAVADRALKVRPGQAAPDPDDVIAAADAVALKQDKSFAVGQIALAKPVYPVVRPDAERWASRRAVAGRDFGIAADGATDDAPAINGVLAALGARGGGVLQLPLGVIAIGSPIDNKYARVLVEGPDRENIHDAGSSVAGTRIVPTGSFSGIALLRHRTPYASELGVSPSTIAKNSGGGFRFIETFGGPRGLDVDSVALGEYDLSIISAGGDRAANFKAGITGADMGDAADVQGMQCRLRVRQIDPGFRDTHCVVFEGSVNANVSLNENIDIRAQHYNGHALWLRCADNNGFSCVMAVRPGGTGKSVMVGDAADYNPNIGGNTFNRLSGVGGFHLLGTDTPGAIANHNLVLELDNGNGSPLPTAGTGSGWQIIGTTTGIMLGQAMAGLALGESFGNAEAARNALAGESLHIRNGSSRHLILSDTFGNEWAVRIDGGNGNLDFLRLAGSGAMSLPDVAALKIGGKQASVGALDSGGAGFRAVRIPN